MTNDRHSTFFYIQTEKKVNVYIASHRFEQDSGVVILSDLGLDFPDLLKSD
jgi:hypothetical protein